MKTLLHSLSWAVMVLLALATAAYATALLTHIPLRSSFVLALLAERPVATLSHFGGSALALAIGGFQVLPWLRNRYTTAHRWMGRLYVLGVCWAACPACSWLGMRTAASWASSGLRCWRCPGSVAPPPATPAFAPARSARTAAG
jgi:hypothetical protein